MEACLVKQVRQYIFFMKSRVSVKVVVSWLNGIMMAAQFVPLSVHYQRDTLNIGIQSFQIPKRLVRRHT